MLRCVRETAIQDIVSKNPHLFHIKSDVFGIAERLKEYDDNIFVLYNAKTQKYEVHSLDNKGNTFCFNVPFRQLDVRTVDFVRKFNVRTRGTAIFKEMDEINAKLEKSKERQRRNDIRGIAEKMAPHFKKFAWEEL